MKGVKIKRVSEGLYELEPPFWCWSPHPYVADGLRRIVAGGDLPLYICKKVSFRDIWLVMTIPISALRV